MILELLKNVLTDTQFHKTKRLLEGYPQLLKGEEVIASTSTISKKTGIRSDHVIRDLKKIASVCGRLNVEPVYLDVAGFLVTNNSQQRVEEERVKLGGRNNSRGVKINWVIYTQ